MLECGQNVVDTGFGRALLGVRESGASLENLERHPLRNVWGVDHSRTENNKALLATYKETMFANTNFEKDPDLKTEDHRPRSPKFGADSRAGGMCTDFGNAGAKKGRQEWLRRTCPIATPQKALLHAYETVASTPYVPPTVSANVPVTASPSKFAIPLSRPIKTVSEAPAA